MTCTLLFWIDTLCINHKETQERNEQVPRMDKIYGMAHNVCIWLSDADEDSNLAMSFIAKVLALWDFDKLIENKEMAKHWAALITLMKDLGFRDAGSSRKLPCPLVEGRSTVAKNMLHGKTSQTQCPYSWRSNHRFSEVMILDNKLGKIPDFPGVSLHLEQLCLWMQRATSLGKKVLRQEITRLLEYANPVIFRISNFSIARV